MRQKQNSDEAERKHNMYALTVSDLSLSFGTTPILEKVSFALDETDRLGIIGVNGSGKSTLFRLITGEQEPTEGNIFLSKGACGQY